MKIVLEIDERIPLKDGDLLTFKDGKVQSIKKSVLLRELIAENEILKQEIKSLRISINKLGKVIKEITK